MQRHVYALLSLLAISGAFSTVNAQTIFTCVTTSVPPVVRQEGITERVGDIVLNCSGGAPGATVVGNLSIFVNISLTNRAVNGTVSDVIFTIDNGSGPQPVNVPGNLTSSSTLVYNGVTMQLSAAGTATLRIANLRVAANQLMAAQSTTIQAYLGFTAGNLVNVTNNQLPVGVTQRGLYGGLAARIVCGPNGSPFPADIGSFTSFINAGTVYASTRLTEGFGDAFSPRGAWQSLNADTPTRIIVHYSGFPSIARLFVPDVIAGSDTVQPTGGADYGLAPSGGKYAPSTIGTLLLARVKNANANGAGGTAAYSPGPAGSGIVIFDAVSEVTLTNGAGYAVYEVVDANANVQESAQFPTFLGVPRTGGDPIQTSEDFSFAPLSTVTAATASDPIPRFQQFPVPNDCGIVGDCGAFYYPRLTVLQSALSFTAQTGSAYQIADVILQNNGGGVMQWNVLVSYNNGAGWLTVSPNSGMNNGGFRVTVLPANLTPGVYQAIVTVDAGSLAGSQNIPVTLTVTGAPPVVSPTVSAVVNAATFIPGPLVPGSFATIMGSKFTGSTVTVSFDGLLTNVLFHNDTQINLLVPTSLVAPPPLLPKNSTQLVVNVDGFSSAPLNVPISGFDPGIFTNGILNQDYSLNTVNHPAQSGSIIQIFATGLSGNGVITARIAGQTINQPYYGGPAPGFPGLQQVDLLVPAGLTGPTSVSVCGGVSVSQVVCSPAALVFLQ